MAQPAKEYSRCLLALDVVAPESELGDQVVNESGSVLRWVLGDVLGEMFGDAGASPSECAVLDYGSGCIVIPPQSMIAENLIFSVLGPLEERLKALKSACPVGMQVRAAIHIGSIRRDEDRISGSGVDTMIRLLEAVEFRRLMHRSTSIVGLIASAAVHDSIREPSAFEFTKVDGGTGIGAAWVSQRPRSSHVHRGPSGFIGRSAEMAQLDAWLLDPSAARPKGVVIHGPSGVGKTTLAHQWATRNRSRFPGGVVFLDRPSQGRTRFAQVLEAVGVQPDRIPANPEDRPAAYADHMAGRIALLILDDEDSAQAAQITSLADDVTTLITTRDVGDAAGVPDTFHRLALGSFTPDESRAALRSAIGAERADRESSAIDALADHLENQPLALSIAGSNLSSWPHDSISDQLARLESVPTEARPGAEAVVRMAVTVTYESLADDLRRAFRFISLTGGLDLTPRNAAELLEIDEGDAEQLLDALHQAHLVESLDGRRCRIRRPLLDFARERCQAEDTDEERNAATGRFVAAIQREHMPEGVVLPDFWTLRDSLSYAPFADAIAAFLRGPGTRPPLTIGIKGAWGSGKTTLMRMLRHRLDPDPAPARTGSARRLTNRELVRRAARAPRPQPPEDPARRTTVWFNPWMYQQAEQVWAGLAHEIIAQVTERMAVADRERFWLRLNRARVDGDAVRRRCYRILFGRLLPLVAVWAMALMIVAVVALTATAVAPAAVAVARSVAWAAAGGGTGAALVWCGVRAVRFWYGRVSGPLTGLLRAPGPPPDVRRAATDAAADPIWSDPAYRTRTGYLHAVHDDVRHVLGLVATEQRPLVVFVDDLDRCDSRTVAVVIEALNLFLAGEFPNCVFVVAMEPSAVAAHIEAAHPELVAAQHMGRLPGDWSSLGWRFLDKIVQLPLTLPTPRGEHIPAYVGSLLRHGPDDVTAESGGTVPGAAPRPGLPVDRVTDVMRQHGPTPENVVEIALAAQSELRAEQDTRRPERRGIDLPVVTPKTRVVEAAARPASGTGADALSGISHDPWGAERADGWGGGSGHEPLEPAVREAAMRIYAELYDDARARQAITAALPVLGSRNPREIKRFVNLFRFYSYIALANTVAGHDSIPPRQLAKLTALVVRWPHLLARLGHIGEAAEHPVNELERAARGDDAEWDGRAAAYLDQLLDGGAHAATDGQASWLTDLRAFLAREPTIGNAAALL